MKELTTEKCLKRIKEAQESGMRVCPRCGRLSMYEDVYENALSRNTDLYICPDCGTDEALEAYTSNILPLEEWVMIKWMKETVLTEKNGVKIAKSSYPFGLI